MNPRVFGMATLIVILAIALPMSCGNLSATGSSAPTILLRTELAALQPPEGTDVRTFQRLKEELIRQVADIESAKCATTPPSGEGNQVQDLILTDNGDGTRNLTWHYRNIGDYDQNGTVGISDLTPLAMHYGEELGDHPLVTVVDGSNNERVDIADVTPIAQNFGVTCAGYSILVADTESGEYSSWMTVDFNDSFGGDAGWLTFEKALSFHHACWFGVAPYDHETSNGVRSLPVHHAPVWHVETIDEEGDAGFWPSLAFDRDGFPAISYQAHEPENLLLARWDGEEWHLETLDDQISTGRYTSLKFDWYGYPSIAYYWNAGSRLQFAYIINGLWQIDEVDHTYTDGEFACLDYDRLWNPVISYRESQTDLCTLKVAWYNGSEWEFEVIDEIGNRGGFTSLEITNADEAYISYTVGQGDPEDLKLAHWDGAAWETETVYEGGIWNWTSLALDKDQKPMICFTRTDGVYFAKRDNEAWDISVLEAGDFMAVSCACDSYGNPAVSYYNCATGEFKFGWWRGDQWEFSVFDTGTDLAIGTSLEFDTLGNPTVAYNHRSECSLKLARFY